MVHRLYPEEHLTHKNHNYQPESGEPNVGLKQKRPVADPEGFLKPGEGLCEATALHNSSVLQQRSISLFNLLMCYCFYSDTKNILKEEGLCLLGSSLCELLLYLGGAEAHSPVEVFSATFKDKHNQIRCC